MCAKARGSDRRWARRRCAHPFFRLPFTTMLPGVERGKRVGRWGLLPRPNIAGAKGGVMRSLSGKELELKLDLTPQELQRVGTNPALEDLTVGKPVTRVLRSIYFDTPDHRLWARGISLRLRAIGDQWVQTIKAGTRVKNGVSNPDELEAAVGSPEPDLSAIDDPRVRRTIERAVKASALEPQF